MESVIIFHDLQTIISCCRGVWSLTTALVLLVTPSDNGALGVKHAADSALRLQVSRKCRRRGHPCYSRY